jgi:indole-3-acetate monooxygenase
MVASSAQAAGRDADEDPAPAGAAAAMIAGIRANRGAFEAAARRAEEERTLPVEVVELMRELGIFWLKTPASPGGGELSPTEFAPVLEELASIEASAAWAAMVGNGTTGTMAGWLPDDGVAEMFARAARPPIFAGQFVAAGRATAVEGGYRVSGRWGFCSGIEHADRAVGCCTVDGPAGGEIVIAVPVAESTRHDTWHVAGLQGTGSGDFSLTDAFVPAGRTFGWAGRAQRGGPLYRQSHALFVANQLGPGGRRDRAPRDRRPARDGERDTHKGSAGNLGGHAVFRREIARGAAQIRALQLLYRDAVERAWEATLAGPAPDATLTARVMAGRSSFTPAPTSSRSCSATAEDACSRSATRSSATSATSQPPLSTCSSAMRTTSGQARRVSRTTRARPRRTCGRARAAAMHAHNRTWRPEMARWQGNDEHGGGDDA